MKKQKSVKIKRSKTRLYKKRKSPLRKALEIIALVVVAGGLVFLGYSAAGPLISYLQGDSGTTPITQWTPDESLLTSETTADTETAPEVSETEPEPAELQAGDYLIPESAMYSSQAFSKALSDARNGGFACVMVPVKAESGSLLYRSNIDEVKDKDIIVGTMPVQQIISMIKSNGLTAKALLPTLKDNETPGYVEDACYRFADDSYTWLDASAERGGKRWLDPFRSNSSDYLAKLAKELVGAGFEQVVISELRFPDFTDYDKTILDQRNFSSTRYTALTSVYNKINSAASGKIAVAVNAADVLSKSGTAEILKDGSFSGAVYLMIAPADFGAEWKISDTQTLKLPADDAQKAKAIYDRVSASLGKYTVIPVIEGVSAETSKKFYETL